MYANKDFQKDVKLVSEPEYRARFRIESPSNCESTGYFLISSKVFAEIHENGFFNDDEIDLLTFEICNKSLSRKIATSFTEIIDHDFCVCPTWMKDYLGVEEDSVVTLLLYSKKNCFNDAEYVVFQPLDEEGAQVSSNEVETNFFEKRLQKHYKFLTQGSIIDLNEDIENRRGKSHLYKIVLLKPSKTVNILNVDLEYNVDIPLTRYTHSWGEEEEVVDDQDQK